MAVSMSIEASEGGIDQNFYELDSETRLMLIDRIKTFFPNGLETFYMPIPDIKDLNMFGVTGIVPRGGSEQKIVYVVAGPEVSELRLLNAKNYFNSSDGTVLVHSKENGVSYFHLLHVTQHNKAYHHTSEGDPGVDYSYSKTYKYSLNAQIGLTKTVVTGESGFDPNDWLNIPETDEVQYGILFVGCHPADQYPDVRSVVVVS
jgi:hypothetical protein